MTVTTSPEPFNSLGFIMAFEGGELTSDEVVEGFQCLIDSGLCWKLQGCYGRTAANLIENGHCVDTHNVVSSRPATLPNGTQS